MPRTRIFTVRDRRALTAVLTAGLRHTDIDTIIHSHPVPGDPGHDAGKAGRVGLPPPRCWPGATTPDWPKP